MTFVSSRLKLSSLPWTWYLLALLIAGSLIAFQLPASASPLVLKFSHVVAEETPKGQAALEFKKLVETRSKGKIKVEVYPESVLYKDKEELEALQLGAVHILAPSLAKFGQLGIRDFEVFDIPYLFSSPQTLSDVVNGEIGRELLNQLGERGIKGLAFWDNGPKVISSNNPVRLPSDLKGKRFRIQPSRTLEAQVDELGATPIAMPFSEVYEALESGFVDSTENPPSNFYSRKMYKVQRYLTMTNHGHLGYAVIVNKKFWENLPRDVRELLESCLKAATVKNNEISAKMNQEAMNEIRKRKLAQVIDLTPEQLSIWKAKLQPVRRKSETWIDEGLIEKVRRTDARYSSVSK
jgi:C4-dicarboxylate-binding protein DctP